MIVCSTDGFRQTFLVSDDSPHVSVHSIPPVVMNRLLAMFRGEDDVEANAGVGGHTAAILRAQEGANANETAR